MPVPLGAAMVVNVAAFVQLSLCILFSLCVESLVGSGRALLYFLCGKYTVHIVSVVQP